MIIVIIVFPHLQVVDENSVRYDHVNDDPKYYVVKAEWFWTRIAEGYAPEDDFLYKDVRIRVIFRFLKDS
jgi:hypothetical protein